MKHDPEGDCEATTPKNKQFNILVAIPTRNRNSLLRSCLEGISKLHVDGFSLAVLVVDNNDKNSLEPVVDKFSDNFPFTLHYAHCAKVGLSSARNVALSIASSGNFDALAFIDDDEFPGPEWLYELYLKMKINSYDAVQGQVRYIFPDGVQTDSAGLGEMYFEQKNRRTEKIGRAKSISTNNVLISKTIFLDAGIRFDEKFNLMGGEDTDFFYCAHLRGLNIQKAKDCFVYEYVSADRLSTRWFLRRIFRVSNCGVAIHLKYHGLISGLLKFLPKIIMDFTAGLAFAPVAAFSRAAKYLCCKRFASAVGALFGLFGVGSMEYKGR